MKEKRNIYCLKALTVAAVICFAGCSDDFLKDKKYMEVTTLQLYMKITKRLQAVWIIYISVCCLAQQEVPML